MDLDRFGRNLRGAGHAYRQGIGGKEVCELHFELVEEAKRRKASGKASGRTARLPPVSRV